MNVIQSALAGVSIGQPCAFRNLAMFPLVSEDEGVAHYLTLEAALGLGGIQVEEVSDGGSVGGIRVVNRLDQPVLLLDGEEVAGAKQNRVFNLTILVSAATELLVPVSCVEAGRWSRTSSEFRPTSSTQYATGRFERMAQVSESLSARGARDSDQSRVWENIAGKRRRMGVESPTSAMSDIYDRYSGGLEEFVQALTPVAGQVFGDETAPALALGSHSEVKGRASDPYRHIVGLITDDIQGDTKRL